MMNRLSLSWSATCSENVVVEFGNPYVPLLKVAPKEPTWGGEFAPGEYFVIVTVVLPQAGHSESVTRTFAVSDPAWVYTCCTDSEVVFSDEPLPKSQA